MSLSDDFSGLHRQNPSSRTSADGETHACYVLYEDNEAYIPARPIDFVQQDGCRRFVYYSYLMGADYDPKTSTITLAFTTKTIVLQGSNLQGLYKAIMLQTVREISEINPRYAATQSTNLPLVTGIVEGDC